MTEPPDATPPAPPPGAPPPPDAPLDTSPTAAAPCTRCGHRPCPCCPPGHCDAVVPTPPRPPAERAARRARLQPGGVTPLATDRARRVQRWCHECDRVQPAAAVHARVEDDGRVLFFCAPACAEAWAAGADDRFEMCPCEDAPEGCVYDEAGTAANAAVDAWIKTAMRRFPNAGGLDHTEDGRVEIYARTPPARPTPLERMVATVAAVLPAGPVPVDTFVRAVGAALDPEGEAFRHMADMATAPKKNP